MQITHLSGFRIISFIPSTEIRPKESDTPSNSTKDSTNLSLSRKVLENNSPQIRLFSAAPIPSQHFKPALRSTLSPYKKPFEISWWRYFTLTTSALDDEMQKIGYTSAEKFLLSQPTDLQKSENTDRKNPREDAVIQLTSGGYKEIMQYLNTRYEFYKKAIESERPEKKHLLAWAFLLEMQGNEREWTAFMKNDGDTIIKLSHAELNRIKFKKSNRWFSSGPWTNTADKIKWTQDWLHGYKGGAPLLTQAKEQVQMGVQDAVKKLSATLAYKITELAGDLNS